MANHPDIIVVDKLQKKAAGLGVASNCTIRKNKKIATWLTPEKEGGNREVVELQGVNEASGHEALRYVMLKLEAWL